MKAKYLAAAIAVFLGNYASAQTGQNYGPNDNKYFTLLQTTVKPALVNGSDSDPSNQYNFFIVWKADQAPQTFLWDGPGAWMNCNVTKAHGVTITTTGYSNVTQQYSTDPGAGTAGSIHKGDTLCVATIKGGYVPAPPKVPTSTKNALVVQPNASEWIVMPVTNILKEKAD